MKFQTSVDEVVLNSGRLRIHIHDGVIDFRVIGENHKLGVATAMNRIAKITQHFKAMGIVHETQKRRWGDDGSMRKVDAVVLHIPKSCEGCSDRRQRGDRRRQSG